MESLILKVVVTPALIGAATLAGRRWGAAVGGVDEGMFEVRRLAGQVFGAAMHVAVEGTGGQVAEAHKVLADAKRRLYGVLSREDVSGDE